MRCPAGFPRQDMRPAAGLCRFAGAGEEGKTAVPKMDAAAESLSGPVRRRETAERDVPFGIGPGGV